MSLSVGFLSIFMMNKGSDFNKIYQGFLCWIES